ncbi:hypothetical protein [Acidianus ambivalens]|uniref:Uncharacterized protein n=1 Tax=Acidianus ambivalens TaxID=2283 RepID=A0A650CUL1_ACIAM|nr:hypothetical protein [Acidianus ambivalens]MQL55951.1 hypothetical protein [Acidianus ambivalens]QGR21488.1 hypothetical protein D1866_05430 [Acidianus ambivalens]
MKRILRIPRFTKDGKPKTLELLVDSASINDKGFAQEAKFLLVIDDGNNRVGFQLTTAEASLLYHRLGYALNEASKEYIEMEEKSKKNYEEKKGSKKSEEEEDFSDLMDEEE